MRRAPRTALPLVAISLLTALTASSSAFAFPDTAWPGRPDYGDTCWFTNCHAAYNTNGTGPHGNFSTTTRQCDLCHTLHDAPTDFRLLPEETITDTCWFCHDGTGGKGVYGTIQARTGTAPSAVHSCLSTNTIPGGDPGGGDAVGAFSEAGNLGCGDCHSPHGQNCVVAFSGERARNSVNDTFRNTRLSSTKLLKRRPTGATADVAEYGSDWCLACHKGRGSGGAPHNHPVDSAVTTSTPYVYDRVPRMASLTAVDTVVIESMGRTLWNPSTGRNIRHNLAFVMPWPRVPEQEGHAPICQQCHEDSRSVGSVGNVQPAVVSGVDGWTSTDNPRFQNFPHETVNARFLAETADDLCTNCHDAADLP